MQPATTLPPPPPPPRLGGNNFLQAQLASPGARLARIYAFSYEGHYYDLGTPAIFLVHGPGRDPEAFRPALFVPGAEILEGTSGCGPNRRGQHAEFVLRGHQGLVI